MKAGTIIMVMSSASEGEQAVAMRAAGYLGSKGHRNIRIASLQGEVPPFDVMSGMFREDGVDTFCILPLVISEGRLTVKLMPESLHLPDNSGSWTMVEGHDVATRFATALGRDPRMARAIISYLGAPSPEAGILVLAYGSDLSQSAKTAEYFAERIREAGWKASVGYTARGSCDAGDAAEGLRRMGCSSIRVLPLFISFDGSSATAAKRTLADPDVEFLEPVSSLEAFYEILDSKVPEGW